MKGAMTKGTVNNLSGKWSLNGGVVVGRVGVLYNDPLNRQTDKNKNITFPKRCCQAVNIILSRNSRRLCLINIYSFYFFYPANETGSKE